MRWTKIGKIFDPTDFKLPLKGKEFAQSPQALVFNDFVRIYFSSREREATSGKYLSHICYADFNLELNEVISVSKDPVIELGNLGCFDEHGIFPLNILRHENKLFGFIGGWNRRVSVSIDGAIGLAFSNDGGNTFQRSGDGPILGPSLNEPFLVGDPFVLHANGKFYMWYIFGLRWVDASAGEPEARVYKITQATSSDGVNWERNSDLIVSDKLGHDECQALPTVFFHEGKYHMIFCFRQATGFRKVSDRGYRLGYAYSNDLINWERNDDLLGIAISVEGWDSTMMCYPHVFKVKNKICLLYNGNDFGRLGFGLAILDN